LVDRTVREPIRRPLDVDFDLAGYSHCGPVAGDKFGVFQSCLVDRSRGASRK